MSLLFAGNSVLSGERDVIRFGSLRFWAERGLIHYEDERDNSYESISVRVALQRVKAISDMLANSSRRDIYTEDQFDQLNRKRLQDMVDGMTAIMQKARIQGMPSDPSARRDLVRRRRKTMVVPGKFGGGM